jgi:hypothetical protein
MQGKRMYPEKQGRRVFLPGEYGMMSGRWYACTPAGHLGDLSNHDVAEHEDGTITVSPSILVTGFDDEKQEKTIWHGYLERGIWREV